MNLIRHFHPVVYWLLFGYVLVYISYGLIVPYFAIYIGDHTHLSLALVGFIIGGGSLAGTVGGFLGGNLSDRFGRKNVMLGSLYASGCLFIGFVYTGSTALLLSLTILQGFSWAFFDPSSKALMGDLTPQEKRVRIFTYRYICVNLGFAIGPIVGIYLGAADSKPLPFAVAGVILILYAFSLQMVLKWYEQNEQLSQPTVEQIQPITLRAGFTVIRKDRILFYFLLGGLTITTVLGQISVPLSQFFHHEFPDVVYFLGTLWAVHSGVIILCGIPITKLMEKKPPIYAITTGIVFCALGLVCFSFSNTLPHFITAIILLTIGEIFIIPAEYGIIDQITPEDMRGTYYGSVSFTSLGSFIGPGLAGYLLAKWGGTPMFLGLTCIALLSLVFYFRGQHLWRSAVDHVLNKEGKLM